MEIGISDSSVAAADPSGKRSRSVRAGSAPTKKPRLKRVYEIPSSEDGQRILIDRLWPRGLTKEKAEVDEWMKELAPSTALRKWFDHDPAKWPEFRRRYKRDNG